MRLFLLSLILAIASAQQQVPHRHHRRQQSIVISETLGAENVRGQAAADFLLADERELAMSVDLSFKDHSSSKTTKGTKRVRTRA